MDRIGGDPEINEIYFFSKCVMNRWANDRVRVNYLLGTDGTTTIGYNVSSTSANSLNIWGNLQHNETVRKATHYEYKQRNNFKNYFVYAFNEEELKDVTLRSV